MSHYWRKLANNELANEGIIQFGLLCGEWMDGILLLLCSQAAP